VQIPHSVIWLEDGNRFTGDVGRWEDEEYERQEPIWSEASRPAMTGRHPFYERLNRVLDKRRFDAFDESAGRDVYVEAGRPWWRRTFTFVLCRSNSSRESILNERFRDGTRWLCGLSSVLS
jgi:hypothetical protein